MRAAIAGADTPCCKTLGNAIGQYKRALMLILNGGSHLSLLDASTAFSRPMTSPASLKIVALPPFYSVAQSLLTMEAAFPATQAIYTIPRLIGTIRCSLVLMVLTRSLDADNLSFVYPRCGSMKTSHRIHSSLFALHNSLSAPFTCRACSFSGPNTLLRYYLHTVLLRAIEQISDIVHFPTNLTKPPGFALAALLETPTADSALIS
jgi:hypothetical protein